MVWEERSREAPPYPDVCQACLLTRGCESRIQLDGGEGLAKRKGVVVRRGLKEAFSKVTASTYRNRIVGSADGTSPPCQ